jgi:hypothetical protein
MAETRIKDATDRRGQDMISQTALRGQGSVLQGHMLTNQLAQMEHQRAQANSDRTYALEAQKYGTETAQKNETARNASSDAYNKEVTAGFTTKDDKGNEVVDKQQVAAHMAGGQAMIADAIAKARATGHGDIADRIEKEGFASLGPKQKQQITQGLAMKQLVQASHGSGPGTGNFIESPNPMDYAIVGQTTGAFGNPLYKTHNGSTVPTRAVNWDKGGNMILPNSVGNHPVKNFTAIGQ